MILWTVVLLGFAVPFLWVNWPISVALVMIWLTFIKVQVVGKRDTPAEFAQIAERADAQHAAYLAGRLEGIYGQYMPNQLFLEAAKKSMEEQPPPGGSKLPSMGADDNQPILERVRWVAGRVKTLSDMGKKTPQDFTLILAGQRWLTIVAEQLGLDRDAMVALARTAGANLLTVDNRQLYVTGDGQVLDPEGNPIKPFTMQQKQMVDRIVSVNMESKARAEARKVANMLAQHTGLIN